MQNISTPPNNPVSRKFGILSTIIKIFFLIALLIWAGLIAHRLYLLTSGKQIAGEITLKDYPRRRPGTISFQGHYVYDGKQYRIRILNFADVYEVGTVNVYVNPNKPQSYFVNQPGRNKYVTAIMGNEVQVLIILIAVGLMIKPVSKIYSDLWDLPHPNAKK